MTNEKLLFEQPQEEMRVCRDCGRELPVSKFRGGKRKSGTCIECETRKGKETRATKKQVLLQAERSKRLKDFTDDELWSELKGRGYIIGRVTRKRWVEEEVEV